jgi:hypothetical protein
VSIARWESRREGLCWLLCQGHGATSAALGAVLLAEHVASLYVQALGVPDDVPPTQPKALAETQPAECGHDHNTGVLFVLELAHCQLLGG